MDDRGPLDLTKRIEEIEQVKKEADQLMINKIIKYEKEIYELKKELAREKEEHQYDNLVHDKEIKRAVRRGRTPR
jgi:hypothetical protein